MKNNSRQIQLIYHRVVDNAKLFLKKALAEILVNGHAPLTNEHAVLSCLYVQMATELSVKAFLIEKEDIRVILSNQFQTKTDTELEALFQANGLHTKKFEILKQHIVKHYASDFDQIDKLHFDVFQSYRNKLVHFNLYLNDQELEELKLELVYVIAQIIVKLLSHLDFAYDSPTEFYRENLEDSLYNELLNYEPYRQQMTKIAKAYTGYAYECLECYQQTFSPKNNRCYYCEADFTYMTEYLDCKICNAKNAVVFDPLNITHNGNIINGLCMNCGDSPMVFKCPNCERKIAYYDQRELAGTCYDICIHID